MKRVKIMKFLVCVFVGGNCKDLFYSENLKMLPTVKKLYKGCEIEVYDIVPHKTLWDRKKVRQKKLLNASNSYWLRKRGKSPVKVICTTTGRIFSSVNECSRLLGIPRMTIYQAINKNFAASKMRFEYYFDENDKICPEDMTNEGK